MLRTRSIAYPSTKIRARFGFPGLALALILALPGVALAQDMAPEMASDPLDLPMTRMASGTAWQPDATPMEAVHRMPGAGWMLMLHWNVLAGYDAMGSRRRSQAWESTNWGMVMAEHELWGGLFTARVMLSLEPLSTGGPAGYPMLLQTGETANGVPLHDRQHPHDLFMESAVDYRHALGESLGLELYLAPSGEPALGPVAYPHRESSLPNPFAVIGHHWEDSSHISFGVVTLALYGARWKAEASWFNGHEPDENRYDYDFHMLDAYSGRVTFTPSEHWALQASYGYLRSPEALEPGVDVQRATVSALYDRALPRGNWSAALVVGHNQPSQGSPGFALLAESSLRVGDDTVFGRAEAVQKTAEDLVVTLPPASSDSQWVGALELGYLRRFYRSRAVDLSVGAAGLLGIVGRPLLPAYGTQAPLGCMVFLRFSPTAGD